MATQKQPGRAVVPDPMVTAELFDPAPYRRQAWLTKTELSQHLNVSERTIERKIRAGLWPCHRDGPHWLRFSPRDVDTIEAALAQGAVNA